MSALTAPATDRAEAAVPATVGDVPTITAKKVWHVGTLDPADRTDWSYEGDGLSVSVNPDDWDQIARLDGPTWMLRRADRQPLRFLDAHAVTPEQRTSVEQWALAAGWVRRETWWAVGRTDEDGEPAGHSLHASEDEARDEAGSLDDDGDAHPVWEVCDHLVATDTFPAERVLSEHPWEVLLTVWVARLHPDLDGVWWADRYDPYGLSCPRGVLVHGLRDVAAEAA